MKISRLTVVAWMTFGISSPSVLAGEAAPASTPQPTVNPADPVIALPPMVVNETAAKAPPWLYVRTDGGECLSRCPAPMTREFVRTQQNRQQLLRLLVPDSFLVKMDVPFVLILDRQERQQGADAVARDMVDGERETQATQPELRSAAARVRLGQLQFLPNLRLDDLDATTLFAYVDSESFKADRLVLAPEYIRFLLERRAPMLPAWLTHGILGVYTQASMIEDPIPVQPTVWLSNFESRALERDPQRPRILLPMDELFAPDALEGKVNKREQRARIWRMQTALFFRWALDSRHPGARDAFWKFAARASEAPATEEMFEACFGFGFSDMRDRLSDYLPLAVKDPLQIDVGPLPKPSPMEVSSATPEQVSRLLGEWERMEIPYVRARYPEFLDEYIRRARLTLQRAYSRGDRDPRLLASLGLCEIDAGNGKDARGFLESAMTARVVRPRVYYEIARMRFLQLTRDVPATQRFPAAELAPIVEPLRIALTQAPALPEVYGLLVDTWLRSSVVPPPADLAALREGVRLFAPRAVLVYRVALLHAMAGRTAEAQTLLLSGAPYVADEALSARFAELKTSLSVAQTGP